MTSEPTDAEAAFQYELRRRLAVVHATAETMLEDPDGSLTVDQRESVETILAASNELSSLVAHDPETVEPALEPDADGDVAAPTPSVDDPDRSASIDLVLESGPFADVLVDQLEQSGYEPTVVSSVDDVRSSAEGADAARHVVLDWRAFPEPSIESLTALFDRLEAGTSIALLSVVDDESIPAPVLGVSGLLSPRASTEMVADVLASIHFDPDDEPRVVVATVDDDAAEGRSMAETLEAVGCAVDTVSVAELRSHADRDGIDCVFLSADGVDTIDDATLRSLRTPETSLPVPVVVVGPTPKADDWLPVCGSQRFVRRSVTAHGLAGEILLAIDPEAES
ncbi:hypothetical protein [Natronorubrum texcoconense]|uniref:Uncharacterized protein n=1 Tax=Natronorubrum texcoconense TaxID=1095776 RepID=A0A1G9B7V0_9EURY|nr:hypothetical protein [Natronorubrum texcoconense]SDK35632.1 hypothetical protein SAMN04515672_2860 [Natronorubrum texcoconense]